MQHIPRPCNQTPRSLCRSSLGFGLCKANPTSKFRRQATHVISDESRRGETRGFRRVRLGKGEAFGSGVWMGHWIEESSALSTLLQIIQPLSECVVHSKSKAQYSLDDPVGTYRQRHYIAHGIHVWPESSVPRKGSTVLAVWGRTTSLRRLFFYSSSCRCATARVPKQTTNRRQVK